MAGDLPNWGPIVVVLLNLNSRTDSLPNLVLNKSTGWTYEGRIWWEWLSRTALWKSEKWRRSKRGWAMEITVNMYWFAFNAPHSSCPSSLTVNQSFSWLPSIHPRHRVILIIINHQFRICKLSFYQFACQSARSQCANPIGNMDWMAEWVYRRAATA